MAGLTFTWEDVGETFVNTLGDELTVLAVRDVMTATGRLTGHQLITYVFNDHLEVPTKDALILMRESQVTEGWTRK